MLSGCSGMIVKEDNAPSFETWELCTLLYRPYQMWPNWTVDEDENNTMRLELRSRGIHDSKSCEIIEISRANCSEYGFNINTKEHTECTRETFNGIKQKITQFKDSKTKRKSSNSSFLKDINSGLLEGLDAYNTSLRDSHERQRDRQRTIDCTTIGIHTNCNSY